MATTGSTVDVGQFVRNLLGLRYREVTMTVATLAVVVGAIAFFPGMAHITQGIEADVSPGLLALFLVVAVVAGAIKGMLGFGYALIATPVFVSVIGPTSSTLAVVALAIPPWMINVFQVGETDTGLAFVREEWVLMTLAVVGAVVGVVALSTYSTGPAVPFVVGLVILAYALFEVFGGFITVEEAHHPVALGIAGALEGFLLAVSNLGPLLPAYFHTFERDTERYIGGLSMVFVAIFTTRIVVMLVDGLMTPYRLWLGSIIAVVTIVGLLAGTYLRRIEIDEQKFNWFVVALLVVIALNILRKTVPALFF